MAPCCRQSRRHDGARLQLSEVLKAAHDIEGAVQHILRAR